MSASRPLNLIRRCQVCQQMRATRTIWFYRNVGMLFARRTYKLNADLCKPCIHKKFWEFTAKNILIRPWGTASLFVTPIYLVQNTGHYLSALYMLRDGQD